MQVDKIDTGTVIDHMRAGKAGRIMRLLGIDENYPHRVAVMLHVPSKKMGTKDMLKIEGKLVSADIANVVALLSPGATINIIKSGKVEKKYEVVLPEELKNVGKCANPNCITTENSATYFKREGEKYRCHYCERLFKADELV